VRHEGCHASSKDEGYTETEAVTAGAVGEGVQVNVAGKPETRAATHFAGRRRSRRVASVDDEMEAVVAGSTG
jgi:hypothetical protein